MGYFDGLTAASFKRDAEGREVFFIWGKFGTGRIIPSEADGAWIRRYLKIYYICVLVGILPMLMAGGEAFQPRWLLTVIIFALLALAALVPLWMRTRAWLVAGERLTYGEAISASARAHGVVSLSILTVLSLLMVVGSMFVALYADQILIGTLGVILFGACLGLFIWMLRARRRS